MADDGRRGDGAAYQVLVVMECLLEKLKMLNYKQEVVAKHIRKNLSSFFSVRPTFPTQTTGESVSEDDEVEEEMIEVEPSSKPDEILESTIDAAGRYLEWERVLKRTTRDDIGKTQEKVSIIEKYINNQHKHPIKEYLSAQAKLSELPPEILHKILLEVVSQGGDQALLILSHTCQQFKDVVGTDYFKRQLSVIGADAKYPDGLRSSGKCTVYTEAVPEMQQHI
ncbi:uncharacterized protein LOC118309930 isoform X2 [Scophthalmus maximus]|uniref:uncharacterized protein LOC118309930 isoform X2 n=1 Tax=Scophthalmus maximus TaxID=52904 RepID=UPI001FA81E96|nr:uncharacterized protein LOC118309930 isoform X2 [Scophthalmus maximus]